MNILLLVMDTARRDAFEPYGAPRGATATVADLARRGVAVEQAYSTASWTLPSHASMFTGLLPRALGLAQPPGGTPQGARPALEAAGERMLGRVLHEAGFVTHGITTNVWASQHAGFDAGFDSFDYVCSGREERLHQLLSQGRRAQLAWAREGLRSRWDDGAAEAGALLRRQIDAWSGQPTFWFVNLGECHSPYLPPRPWNDLGPFDRARAAVESQRHLNFESICLYAAGHHTIPDGAFERMRHLYARSVAYMDAWLADVLGALDGRGMLDETLVIVTSDHGENFGEHDLIAHGFSVNQQLVHVPLVMAGPGAVAGDGPVSLAALPRIISEAAGIDGHPYGGDAELPGGVAVSQYDPMAPAEDERIVRFAEKWGIGAAGVERLCASWSGVTDGRLKLVVRDGVESVHDVIADPGEAAPLSGAALERETHGVAALRDALAHPGAGSDPLALVADGAPPADGAGASAEPSAEEMAQIERQMKLLGYL